MLLKLNGEDCIVSGKVFKDAELKNQRDGRPYTKFPISMGGNKDEGYNPPINVVRWGKHLKILKNDHVLACGKLKVNEVEGKKYYELNADFIAIENTEEAVEKNVLRPVKDDKLPF